MQLVCCAVFTFWLKAIDMALKLCLYADTTDIILTPPWGYSIVTLHS